VSLAILRCCKKIELYPNRARRPHASVILEIVKRLYKTESVLPKKKDAGRQRYARNMETVLRAVEQEISIRNTIAQRQNCYFLN